MQKRSTRRRALGMGLATAATLVAPAVRGQQRVGVALALACDVSSSVTPERFQLQVGGHIGALLDEEVLSLIESLSQPLALLSFNWAMWQAISVPWMIIRNREDVRLFCGRMKAAQRPQNVGIHTHIGAAIDFARHQLSTGIFSAERRVIDISGDGGNSDNALRSPTDAREAARAEDIVINGLPIIAETTPPQPPQGLDVYYKDEVISGFMVVADGFADVRRALKKKLLFEIA